MRSDDVLERNIILKPEDAFHLFFIINLIPISNFQMLVDSIPEVHYHENFFIIFTCVISAFLKPVIHVCNLQYEKYMNTTFQNIGYALTLVTPAVHI